MRYINRPTIYLPPLRCKLPWYRWNWWPVVAIFLSGCVTVFLIWCAVKAVRP